MPAAQRNDATMRCFTWDADRQKTILNNRPSNSSREIIVNASGTTGASVVAASCSTVCDVNGTVQPFVVELADVALGEDAVLAHAPTLGVGKRQTEHEEGAEDGEHHHGHQSDELDLELGKLGAGVEDPVGEVPR